MGSEEFPRFSFFFVRFSSFFSFFSLFFVFFIFFFIFLFSWRTREPTAIYCKNGEFHSDPVCTDPVQNFPTLAKFLSILGLSRSFGDFPQWLFLFLVLSSLQQGRKQCTPPTWKPSFVLFRGPRPLWYMPFFPAGHALFFFPGYRLRKGVFLPSKRLL